MSYRKLSLSALLIAILAIAVSRASASDWLRFRGPNGAGVNETTGLPTEFGPTKNMIWRTPLPNGYSSPILVGDRIFVTAYEGDKRFAQAGGNSGVIHDHEKLWTIALDRASGKILWRRESPPARSEVLDNRNSPASPSPVSDGKNLFVFFGDYGMVSYGLDGNERWRLPLGPFNNVYGVGVSPVLVDDKVILCIDQSAGSYIAAFGQKDGKQIWKVARPEALSGHSTPSIMRDANGKALIVAPASFRMDVYSADTGEIVWFMHGLASEMKSVPIVDGDTIYINGFNTPENDPGKQVAVPPFEEVIAKFDKNHDGKISIDEAPDQRTKTYFPYIDLNKDGVMDADEWKMFAATMAATNSVMAVKANGKGDMTTTGVKWAYHKSIPQLPSLVLYRDVLYMLNDSGVLTTLNPQTGEVLKQARLRGVSDKYFASPVAADGKVYIAGNSGIVTVLKAGGDQEVLAANQLDEDMIATPAIADGRIYVRTVSALYCFGEK